MTLPSPLVDDPVRALAADETAPPPLPDARRAAEPADGLDAVRCSLVALARRLRPLVGHADAVGITMLLGGRALHAGGDLYAEEAEAAQHALGEGPGPDALAGAGAVRTGELTRDDPRWPGYGARAAHLGVRGQVAVPLLAGDERLGWLSLYGRTAGAIDATGDEAVDRALRAVLPTLLGLRLRALLAESAQCLGAVAGERVEVDLAVGLLADRYGFSAHQSLVLVVQLARQDGVSTADAARALTGRVVPR